MPIFNLLQSLGLLFLLCLPHGKPAVAFPTKVPHHRNDDAPTYPSPALEKRDLGYYDESKLNPLKKSFRHYTAIGDGFAAGLGLDKTPFADDTQPECRRREESYPFALLAFKDTLGIQSFNFPACLDAGIYEVKKQIVGSGQSISPLPQVWHDFGQPDLVTISAGFHERDEDVDAEDDLLNRIIHNCYRGDMLVVPGCRYAMIKAQETLVNHQERYEDLYVSALTYNLAEGQKREVYVVSYPLWYDEKGGEKNSLCPNGAGSGNDLQVAWPPFDPDGPEGAVYQQGETQTVSQMMNKIILDLNNKIHVAVDNVNGQGHPGHIYYLDIDPSFEGHRICDTGEPWFNVKSGSDLLRPTVEGYHAMANAIVGAILEQDISTIIDLNTLAPVVGSDLVPTEVAPILRRV